MKTDCRKNLDVFDFKEESEVPELAFRIMSNLENTTDAIDQCTFLETVAKRLPPSSSVKFEPKTMTDSDDAVTVVKKLPQSSPEPKMDLFGSEVPAASASALPSNSKLISHELDDAVDMNPDERGMREGSSLTCSDTAEDDGDFVGPSLDHCTGGWEMDNEDITVVCYPDHMVYRDNYCTDSVLTFTSSYIQMEGSSLDRHDKTFKFQWGIEDILHIKSHWYELVEMAMVAINVLTKDTIQTKDFECTSGSELKFAVVDKNWYGRQEAITSLNVAYKALWSSLLESEDTVVGHTQVSSMTYFPNFDQPFEDVVYPKGEADAVSISKRDIDLLQPDTFVNDTIIDFYIKYLKNNIKPEERHRFHFFNSFFFRKLADPDKDPLNASEGRAAFQRVKKWTRKVNLFEKDFVFIPINYNYHWSLIVMCHLGEVATYKDANEMVKVPCILHMDSIRGSHTGLKGLMQSYLKEEWKGRQQEASEDISSRFDNLRFISLELPQQQNSFDCGLFLLHYVELFLDQAPTTFNPFKITNTVNFLNVDWFPPAEASLKRVVIQRLIYDLLDFPYPESPSTNSNDERCNLTYLAPSIHQETAVNFFPDKCQSSEADEGIEISVLPLSSPIRQCAGDSTVASKLLIKSGSFLDTPFLDFNQASFDEHKNSLTPIQEEVEGGGQFVYSPPTETGLRTGNAIIPKYSSLNPPLISEHDPKNDNPESSPETPASGCEYSVQVVLANENTQVDPQVSNFKETQAQPSEPVDVNVNGNDFTTLQHSDMQGSRSSGSDSLSGLESDVQNPTKKMRMTEAAVERSV